MDNLYADFHVSTMKSAPTDVNLIVSCPSRISLSNATDTDIPRPKRISGSFPFMGWDKLKVFFPRTNGETGSLSGGVAIWIDPEENGGSFPSKLPSKSLNLTGESLQGQMCDGPEYIFMRVILTFLLVLYKM